MDRSNNISRFLDDLYLQTRLFTRCRRRDFLVGIGGLVSLGIIQQKRIFATPSPSICWRSPEEIVTVGTEAIACRNDK